VRSFQVEMEGYVMRRAQIYPGVYRMEKGVEKETRRGEQTLIFTETVINDTALSEKKLRKG